MGVRRSSTAGRHQSCTRTVTRNGSSAPPVEHISSHMQMPSVDAGSAFRLVNVALGGTLTAPAWLPTRCGSRGSALWRCDGVTVVSES